MGDGQDKGMGEERSIKYGDGEPSEGRERSATEGEIGFKSFLGQV